MILDNNSELKFSREQGYFDRSLVVRGILASIFVLALFSILHFRESRVEVLELGSIAPSYIVSQVDFDFYDDEATIILKQEAVHDIGKIYQISDNQVRSRRIEFENFLIYNQEWRKYSNGGTFEEMFSGVEQIEKILLQLRMTDPRTIQRMREIGMPIGNYELYTPSDINTEVILPQSLWNTIREKALATDLQNPAATDLIISYLQQRPWKIQDDIPAQQVLRKMIQAGIPKKYTHVAAGSRIIDQDERVTPRHVAMLQAMKSAMSEKRNLWSPMTIAGSLLLSILVLIVCAAYFRVNHPQILHSNRKLSLILTVVILTLILGKLTELFLLNSNRNLMDIVRYPLFVPFASILICSLINPSIATFTAAFLTILFTAALAFEPQGFMLMNLAASIVAILSTRSLRRRKEVFVVCGNAWLSCLGVIISLHLYNNTLWQMSFLNDVISSGVFMLLTAILVVGLLPLLESAFGVMTDVTLMEYMDPNNDLLRRLTIEAPGTYQHSVIVGNLAEAAAVKIGANGLFCRVSTLYHDVGKMATPQYFTENQQGGMNIHQLFTPEESAQVIIAHVSEGVAMARRAGLPEQFIDIIKEHHGTTLVYYFYRKQLEKVGGDKSLLDEKEFRYSGPKPRSKESAIIMIADTLEAASRSIEKVNEENLLELANRLIREKIDDGQFQDCLLTFEELEIVKMTLIKTLVAYWHSRVKYPKRELKGPSSAELQMLNSEA